MSALCLPRTPGGDSPAEVLGQNPRILKSGETPPEDYRALWQKLVAAEGGLTARRQSRAPR
jgi:hypothetical protein